MILSFYTHKQTNNPVFDLLFLVVFLVKREGKVLFYYYYYSSNISYCAGVGVVLGVFVVSREEKFSPLYYDYYYYSDFLLLLLLF